MVKDIFLSIKSIKGMKQLALIFCMLFIFNSCLMGQEQLTENIPKDISDCLTKVGKDTLSTLNLCESKYLNCRFQKNKGTFDFCGKKVAFFKGNTGMIQSTKKDFFDKEKDFINIFNIIKEQFKNYVFDKYNNDIEEIIRSPYSFEQVNDNKLNFVKAKLFGGTVDEVIPLQYGDAVNVTMRKKAYVTNGRGDIRQARQSFEPQWQFASISTKCDTINVINTAIVQEILTKKYNIKFI